MMKPVPSVRGKLSLSAAIGLATTTIMSPLAGAAVTLEEVVVTANRRVESMQSVPLAVTAFSGDAMREMGILDIKGITERTPGFTMGTFNPGQTQLFIRGIGSNEDGAGGDQSVIVFIDEVYIGRSAGMDVDLFDLERVEVLRGPQGTLFGKNVVGGAVNMITKKPTEETEIRFEGTYGRFEEVTLRGLASGQLADNVFAKVAVSLQRRDGYFESEAGNFPEFFPGGVDPEDTLDRDSDSVRLGLRLTPSDRLEVNLSASYSEAKRNGQPEHYIPSDNGALNSGSYRAAAALIPNYDDEIHKGLWSNEPGFFKGETKGVTARFDYELTPSIQFTSLTSYREVESENQDSTGQLNTGAATQTGISALYASVLPPFTFLIFGENSYTDDSDTFTQELRLTSSGDSALQWVAGVYYLQEKTDRTEWMALGGDLTLPGGALTTLFPRIDGNDAQSNETDSYAVFGQLTYDVTDQLSITVGARYTSEEKKLDRVGTPSNFGLIGDFDFSTDEDWDELTSKVSLEYQATDDLFFYYSYSEGFKSGGFQGTASSLLAASTPFDPETAKLHEIGAKTEWFDNRVRLNIAAFHTDYKDLQILQLLVPIDAPPDTPGVLVTQNASDAKIKGVELELNASPVEGLFIQGSATWLDTEYKNFGIPEGFRAPGAGAGPVRDGNELRNAPDFAWNLLARYEWELGDNGGTLALQGEWRHKDQVWQDPDNFVWAGVPEYDIADYRVIYTTPSGNFQIAGWVNNAHNEDYFVHNFPLSNTGSATPGAPRTYGVTVSWQNN